jgi:hypothetical protein
MRVEERMRNRGRHLKLRGKSLASRLTGLSTPWLGASWTPPKDERSQAENLLIYLEDRRALYNPYDMEIGDYVVQSILQIREYLTRELQNVNKSSHLGQSLIAMRAACRKFVDEVQQPPGHRYHMEPLLISCLGELRGVFGIHIAKLAYLYDLEVEGNLASLIPSEPEEE